MTQLAFLFLFSKVRIWIIHICSSQANQMIVHISIFLIYCHSKSSSTNLVLPYDILLEFVPWHTFLNDLLRNNLWRFIIFGSPNILIWFCCKVFLILQLLWMISCLFLLDQSLYWSVSIHDKLPPLRKVS